MKESKSRNAAVEPDGAKVSWSQERRLRFIDFRLHWDGRLNRGDLMEFFEISTPQASTDISRYMKLAPGNLEYDPSSRSYVATAAFKPAYETSGARQYLGELLAMERDVLRRDASFVGRPPAIAVVPVAWRNVEDRVLHFMLRAIRERLMVEVEYQSITRDEPAWRYVSPHAFGYDGQRWHIRAYCHLRSEFRDFVIGRMLEVRKERSTPVDFSTDAAWHRDLTLILVPHPKLKPRQKRGIEIDYGMENAKAKLQCRQAMLPYTLRRLGLNEDGTDPAHRKQIVLENLQDLRPFLMKPEGPPR